MDTDDIRRAVADDMPRTIADLERLVRIPSVGYPGYDPAPVRASAEATADILRNAGFPHVRLLELDGGHPAVVGELPGPDGAPTALLYAHHDVQPAADADAWVSDPFDPQVREGRLYGRGAADDKSGIVVHAAAIRVLLASGPPTCTVKVLVEGEEECSTEHLPELVHGNAELLAADVAVIADGGNVRTGVPTLGTSVRGSSGVTVTVRVLEIAQHSGAFGGAVPDAVMALARMIGSLHDDAGHVAVEGLHAFTWNGSPVDDDDFRREVGLLPGVELIGSGSLADRTLTQPAINVLAFEAPRVVEAANQIVPTARAVIGLRLAPGDDGTRATRLLADHLRAAAPWGVQVDLELDEPGAGYLVDASTPIYAAARSAMGEAFGGEVAEVGSGGSVPIVPMLAEAVPGMQILIWGAGDDRSNYHSLDESVDLADLERLAVTEALFLRNLGATRAG